MLLSTAFNTLKTPRGGIIRSVVRLMSVDNEGDRLFELYKQQKVSRGLRGGDFEGGGGKGGSNEEDIVRRSVVSDVLIERPLQPSSLIH